MIYGVQLYFMTSIYRHKSPQYSLFSIFSLMAGPGTAFLVNANRPRTIFILTVFFPYNMELAILIGSVNFKCHFIIIIPSNLNNYWHIL